MIFRALDKCMFLRRECCRSTTCIELPETMKVLAAWPNGVSYIAIDFMVSLNGTWMLCWEYFASLFSHQGPRINLTWRWIKKHADVRRHKVGLSVAGLKAATVVHSCPQPFLLARCAQNRSAEPGEQRPSWWVQPVWLPATSWRALDSERTHKNQARYLSHPCHPFISCETRSF